MERYARWVFGLAGTGNIAVALAMTLGQAPFVDLMGLDPPTGTNVIVFALAGLLIGLFGVGYWQVAIDPVRYRPLIWLGVAGKLLAAALTLAGALVVPHLWRFFALVSADIVLAVLFADYMRRTAPPPAPGA
jgi:hypothetical protein